MVELAREAGEAGDEPFAGRNGVSGGDRTRDPEFAITRWAVTALIRG